MKIIAEGVEEFEQVMYLRDLGIVAAQGYCFAPPLPGSVFVQLVQAIDARGAKGSADELTGSSKNYVSAVARIAAA
jgi:sensor c-di-GMP phosphodiesterase-like protein